LGHADDGGEPETGLVERSSFDDGDCLEPMMDLVRRFDDDDGPEEDPEFAAIRSRKNRTT
jgi:hypothetical protein